MKSPLASAGFITLEAVDSTQAYAANVLKSGEAIGAILALEQTAGRGRFGRTWHSPHGECLAVSLIFNDYVGHPRPFLIGMGLAVACAQAFECKVQWPNDVVYDNRKVGGILTELLPNKDGQLVPVVGLGINLNQASFPPDIGQIATSLRLIHGHETQPVDAMHKILDQFVELPELQKWKDLAPSWMALDATPSKRYKLQDGRLAIATRVGDEGELVCTVDGQEQRVLAADALIGGS